MVTKLDAARIATKAEDAYSRDRYTTAGWIGTAKRLAAEGFDPAEIDWVLRSKHMRWAGDAANRNQAVTAADFAGYVERHLVPAAGDANGWARLRREAATEINKETRYKTSGAYLAGACDGEQVADLIDTLRRVEKYCPIHEQDAIRKLLAEIERRSK